jgi:hypothetical protein
MRRGPDYNMNIRRAKEDGLDSIYIPLEVMYEFDHCWSVSWLDNKDGTFTITPIDRFTTGDP